MEKFNNNSVLHSLARRCFYAQRKDPLTDIAESFWAVFAIRREAIYFLFCPYIKKSCFLSAYMINQKKTTKSYMGRRIAMIKIAVCDDDRDFSSRMKLLIEQHFLAQSIEADVSIFSNGNCFLSENTDYNAFFLDIDMPDIGGFDVAEQISNDTLIVFVTTHDERVYSSLKFRPFRFIRKAHLEAELPETLDAVQQEILKRSAGKKFMLQTTNGDILLNVNDIEYIEIYDHWLRVYVAGGDILECYGSLSAQEKSAWR